jgi:hypothetical protein
VSSSYQIYNFCLFLSYKKSHCFIVFCKNFVYNEVFITKLKYDFLHFFINREITRALDIPCQKLQNWRITLYRQNYFEVTYTHTYMVVMISLVKIKLLVMMCVWCNREIYVQVHGKWAYGCVLGVLQNLWCGFCINNMLIIAAGGKRLETEKHLQS